MRRSIIIIRLSSSAFQHHDDGMLKVFAVFKLFEKDRAKLFLNAIEIRVNTEYFP